MPQRRCRSDRKAVMKSRTSTIAALGSLLVLMSGASAADATTPPDPPPAVLAPGASSMPAPATSLATLDTAATALMPSTSVTFDPRRIAAEITSFDSRIASARPGSAPRHRAEQARAAAESKLLAPAPVFTWQSESAPDGTVDEVEVRVLVYSPEGSAIAAREGTPSNDGCRTVTTTYRQRNDRELCSEVRMCFAGPSLHPGNGVRQRHVGRHGGTLNGDGPGTVNFRASLRHSPGSRRLPHCAAPRGRARRV
jgi:hypothetical protein